MCDRVALRRNVESLLDSNARTRPDRGLSNLRFRPERGLSKCRGKLLAEKLYRDLRRDFVDCFLNFLGGVGQPVRVDIDPNAALRTRHVLVRLEPPDCLLEVVPAFRTLKPDLMGFQPTIKSCLSFTGYRDSEGRRFPPRLPSE
jgi:hypothetical protein